MRVKRHFTEDVPVDELELVTQLLAVNVMLEAACANRPAAREIARVAAEVELLARRGAASYSNGDPQLLDELATGFQIAEENYSAALLRAARGPEIPGNNSALEGSRDYRSRPWTMHTDASHDEKDDGESASTAQHRRIV